MATIGEVNASTADKFNPLEREVRPYVIYFGVFFDGTNNNMIQKEAAKNIKRKQREAIRRKNKESGFEVDEDYYEREIVEDSDELNISSGANRTVDENGESGLNQNSKKGFSNVAILHSLYQGLSKEEYPDDKNVLVYNIYVEGVGTTPTREISFSTLYGKKDIAFGKDKTGVVYLVSKALEIAFHRISLIVDTVPNEVRNLTEIKFDVYGFSRGATCSRLFSYCVAAEDSVLTCDNLPCVNELLDSYLTNKFIKEKTVSLYGPHTIENRSKVTVDMLGLFDTVSSVGGVAISSYKDNTTDLGLYSPQLERVSHTFHICAIDEFRSHFGLTNLGKQIKNNCGEIYIPGCHSDVGGSYVKQDESFTIQYALRHKEFDIDLLSTKDTLVHLQIAQSRVTRKDKTTDFINYIRNYGYLGEVSIPIPEMGSRRYWGEINDCKITDSPGIVYQDVSVSRKSLGGYSNIPLAIMIERTKKDTDRTVFRSHEILFGIEADVRTLFESGEHSIESLSEVKGARVFYYPGGRWDSPQYKALRKYLHFSAKWFEGNDMYINGNLVERIFYYGDKGDDKMHTYQEYNQ